MSPFRDICTHEDERLAIRSARAGDDCHTGRRSVCRQPASRLVGRLPCRLSCIVDAEFIVKLERPMPKAADLVFAGSNGAGGNVMYTVPSRLGITQEIVAPIPPRGILPRG